MRKPNHGIHKFLNLVNLLSHVQRTINLLQITYDKTEFSK